MIAIMLIIIMMPILLLSLYHPSGTDAATWNFDEGYGNPTDSSSSALATTLSGAIWKTNDLCLSGKCLYFDGSDDYISTSSTTVFDAGGAYTVMAWIRPTFGGESATETFISKTGVVDFNISDTNDNVVVAYTGGTTASSNNNVITANKWHHVAITHDGNGTIAIYVDGNDQTSDSSVTDSNSAASTLFGSELTAASTQSYQGFMDVVKIYTSQLTAAQIKAEYSSAAAIESGISASVGGGTNQSYLSNGLVGYWKMDESSWTVDCSTASVSDSSGNGNNGKACPNSTGPAGGAIGKFGNAGSFDGSNDSVTVSDILDSDYNQAITLAAWVKTSTDGAQSIIAKQDSNSPYSGYNMQFGSSGLLYFQLVNTYSSNAIEVASSSDLNYDDGTWHHVAATYDGSSKASGVKLFFDGARISTTTVQDTLTTTTTNSIPLNIGSRNAAAQYFSGQIDEARIYNRSFSPSEIASLYHWATGPVLDWSFNENTGTSAYDTSTSGNVGAITGSVSFVPGKFGSAARFTTSNTDRVGNDSPINIPANNQPQSITYWYRVDSNPAGPDVAVNILGSGSSALQCGIRSSTVMCWKNGGTELVNATTPTAGIWHHVAYAFDGTTHKLYVDGVFQESSSVSADSGSATNVEIGYNGDSTAEDWENGEVDELKIYNYPITASQVVQDMNGNHPIGGSPIGSQVGYWKFDELADNTCSGGTNDVCNSSSLTTTLDGTSTASRTASGKLNAALDFDGTDDVVTITNTSSIDFDTGLSSGFTISAWVNPDTAGEGSAGQIFQKGSNTYCQLSSSTPFTVTCNLDYATADANTSVSSAMPSGSWTHVAMSYNSTAETISIWINGRKRATSSAGTGGKAADTANLLIGGGTSNNFDGKIDDVKVYSSELTVAEMQIDYNYNSAMAVSTGQTEEGVGTPPVGWWKLDENTGTNAYDSSGNGSTGTATGSPNYVPGKIGSAISLNGSSQYYNMGDPASGVLDFGTGSFSMAAWFKPGGSTLFNAKVISKGAFAGSDGYEMLLDSSTADNQLTVTIGGDGFGGANFYLRTENGFTDTTAFHHALFVFDATNSKAKIYVDGVPQVVHDDTGVSCNTIDSDNINSSTGSCTLTTASSTTNFYLGYDGFNYANLTIDDVKIYNYARSQAQAAYDYSEGQPFAHYKMDECTGTTVYNAAVSAQGVAAGSNGTWSGSSGTNTSAGTCTTSGAWFNGATGKFNSSLDFDGSDDAVSVTNASIIDLNEGLFHGFTFSTWVYPNSDGEGDAGKIFYKGTNTYCQTDGESASRVNITCRVDLSTDAGYTVSSAIPINQWSHIAFSWTNDSDDEVTVWVNGTANTSSATYSGDTAVDTNNLIIGGNATGASNTTAFDGQIDDFRVYPYELTAAQVKLVMNQGAAARFGPAIGTPQP